MIKSEKGRSMVEMLGVLAIIGVLSIGGIAGYTLAMNRIRANEILDAANKVSVVAMALSDNNTKVTPDQVGFTSDKVGNCVAMNKMEGTGGESKVMIDLSGCDDGVQSALTSIASYLITITGTKGADSFYDPNAVKPAAGGGG